MNGIEMMLKSAGIDLPKIQADFEKLKDGVTNTLQAIETRLGAIDKQQQMLIHQQQTILNTIQELTAWQRKQAYQPQKAAPLQQPQPQQPQPVQTEQQQPQQ